MPPAPPLSLLRPDLEPLLAELEQIPEPLARVTAAQRALGPELGRAAAELAALRARARARFPNGDLRHLTAKGLEQASRPAVAAWRAARCAEVLGPGDAFDATCGLGSDALALARAGFAVHLADLDPGTLQAAARNLADAGAPARSAVVARAEAPPWRAARLAAGLLLLDPDRRPAASPLRGGEREPDPRHWSPPLARCTELALRAAAGCIKLAPGIDPAELALAPGALEASWVSVSGELLEVALWTGRGAGRGATRTAVVLGRDGSTTRSGEPLAVEALSPAAAAATRYLSEPDPAVIRAGLLGRVAADAGLAPLAPRSAYLGGDRPGPAGLTRSWRVLGAAPLDRKRLRRLLGELDIGPLTVMKRGHPDPVEVLARRFAGPGAARGLLAVVRLEEGHLGLVLDPAGERQGAAADQGMGDEGFEPPTSSV